MDWILVLPIIGFLGGFMIWMFTKLERDIRASHQRIDQLHQMFVDLLKDKK